MMGELRLVAVIREAAWVLILAVVLAGVGYWVRPAVRSALPDGAGADGGRQDNSPVSVIGLEEARRDFENGTALFADARPKSVYRSGHIPGAVNLDPDEFDAWSGDFFAKISPDQRIITYCQGERCSLSRDLAEKLTWMGYEKVFLLKDGWGKWTAHHLPVEKNAQ
jgi:rhodanese-related sulfurtransferase